MALVECRVAKGAIADEVMVYVQGEEREYESWAGSGKVEVGSTIAEDTTIPGFVHVRIVQQDEQNGRALIELPEEVVMGGRRIWVAAGKLKAKG